MANSEDAKFISRRLRELREQRGLTQEQFAEMAGINYKVYQSFEAGRRWNLEMKTVLKLAAEYELTLSEFFAVKIPRLLGRTHTSRRS